MAAVDQNGELDAACAAEAGDRLDRGAHGAPGVEYVVHENDGRALDARVRGRASARPGAACRRATASRPAR